MKQRSWSPGTIDAQVLWILLVTVSYVVAASIYALITGNKEFVLYIVLMLIMITTTYFVHRRVCLSHGLLWCLSVWGLLHVAGGLLPVPEAWQTRGSGRVLYSLWLVPGLLKYDQVVHAYGFGVVTWFFWQTLSAGIMRDLRIRQAPTLGLMVLCAAGGMGFGALNEVVEFIVSLTIPENNVGGYENTGWDLVANLVGCSIAVAIIVLGTKRRRKAMARGEDHCGL